ncbi:hypothetical protein SAMN05421819_3620 [Bryocella elongata]|uniref:Uncharacterized protein n=1 Tax=Bryocella elongata TaxID=863522 RepID=A0A1H6B972_9BACT|nr:hypothetical protein SAMN05421819_3620 [Bryocella elongata]
MSGKRSPGVSGRLRLAKPGQRRREQGPSTGRTLKRSLHAWENSKCGVLWACATRSRLRSGARSMAGLLEASQSALVIAAVLVLVADGLSTFPPEAFTPRRYATNTHEAISGLPELRTRSAHSGSVFHKQRSRPATGRLLFYGRQFQRRQGHRNSLTKEYGSPPVLSRMFSEKGQHPRFQRFSYIYPGFPGFRSVSSDGTSWGAGTTCCSPENAGRRDPVR